MLDAGGDSGTVIGVLLCGFEAEGKKIIVLNWRPPQSAASDSSLGNKWQGSCRYANESMQSKQI